MALVEISRKANLDLAEIALFYAQTADEETAQQMLGTLLNEIQALANRTLIQGQQVEGLPPSYREWKISKNRYKVYFR